MPEYRRWHVPGGTYFFTLVTHARLPILTTPTARKWLRQAIRQEQAARPFEVRAIVLLPDHLHSIWTLPEGDDNYSLRWSSIKANFTNWYRAASGGDLPRSASRGRKRERAVWQRRFWEHVCRDEDDLKRFLDYLHFNPVKHGLVRRVRDWPYSSFHRYVTLGEYEIAWGDLDPHPNYHEPEWE